MDLNDSNFYLQAVVTSPTLPPLDISLDTKLFGVSTYLHVNKDHGLPADEL